VSTTGTACIKMEKTEHDIIGEAKKHLLELRTIDPSIRNMTIEFQSKALGLIVVTITSCACDVAYFLAV